MLLRAACGDGQGAAAADAGHHRVRFRHVCAAGRVLHHACGRLSIARCWQDHVLEQTFVTDVSQ